MPTTKKSTQSDDFERLVAKEKRAIIEREIKQAVKKGASDEAMAELERRLSSLAPSANRIEVQPRSAEIRLAERAYRRGFQQGAYAAVKAMGEGFSQAQLAAWAELKLHDWRSRGRLAEIDERDAELEEVLIEQRVIPPALQK